MLVDIRGIPPYINPEQVTQVYALGPVWSNDHPKYAVVIRKYWLFGPVVRIERRKEEWVFLWPPRVVVCFADGSGTIIEYDTAGDALRDRDRLFEEINSHRREPLTQP